MAAMTAFSGKSCTCTYRSESQPDINLKGSSSVVHDGCLVSCSVIQELGLYFPGQPLIVDTTSGRYLCRAFVEEECLKYMETNDVTKDKCGCERTIRAISKFVKLASKTRVTNAAEIKTVTVHTVISSRIANASSVVLRLVSKASILDDKDTSSPSAFFPPFDTSAREHISHSLRLGLFITMTSRLSNPSNISYDAIVESCIPSADGMILKCDNNTNITFSQDSSDESAPLNVSDSEKRTLNSFIPTEMNPSDPVEILRALILHPIQFEEDFIKLGMGVSLSSGILLRGPPGVGKTRAVRMIAEECNSYAPVKLISMDTYSTNVSSVGGIEELLRHTFHVAKEHVVNTKPNGRCIIFIDEIDTICPSRKNASFDQARAVAQLLTLMDGLSVAPSKENDFVDDNRILIIAATNKPDNIDPALRRPGRFEREIEFKPPTADERASILRLLLASEKMDCNLTEDEINDIALQAVGFVGSDLTSVVLEAYLSAVNRTDRCASVKLSRLDLENGLNNVGLASSQRTRALRRRMANATGERFSWDHIGGYEDVKLKLKQAIEWPIKCKASMNRLGVSPARGILLYGPPGCAKTTFARVAAESTGCSFITLSGADIYSPYVGDAEKSIREAFSDARLALPAVLFIDELDTVVGKRDMEGGSFSQSSASSSTQTRVLATLLNEMDGIDSSQGLLVLAATNRIDQIDKALLRPGRFDLKICIPLPDEMSRFAILQVHMKVMPLSKELLTISGIKPKSPEEIPSSFEDIIRLTQNYSGAELENVCREAGLEAMRKESEIVTHQHFIKAINSGADKTKSEF